LKLRDFEEKWEIDASTILIAMPCSNVLVVGTDEAYVSDVIGALRGIKPATPFMTSFGRASIAQGMLQRGSPGITTLPRERRPFLTAAKERGYTGKPDPQARGIFVVHEPSKDPRVKFIYFIDQPGCPGHRVPQLVDPQAKATMDGTRGKCELYTSEEPSGLGNLVWPCLYCVQSVMEFK
jgi:hypothetical protein